MKEELARLRGLVERTQSVVSHADASTACEVLPALLDCVEALELAREYIARDLKNHIECCCALIDGVPDESQTDEMSRPVIESIKMLLADIDAALAWLREAMKERG